MNYSREQLNKLALALGEEWDSVQILVSKNEEGFTQMFATGSGNYYGRLGMCHAFIKRDTIQELSFELKD